MKIRNFITGLLVTCFSVAMPAIPHAHAAWDKTTADARILEVVVLQNGEFYARFDKNICTTSEDARTIGHVYPGLELEGVAQTGEGREMLLSQVLAAYLAGKTVRVYAEHPPVNASGDRVGHCRMGAIGMY